MRFMLATLLVFHAGAALADGGECAGWADLDPATKITLAHVSAPKANFVKSASEQSGCPSANPACLRKGFVVSGDPVIVSARENGFACAQFVGAKGLETVGWLPAAALADTTGAVVTPADWAGEWTGNPEQAIKILPSKAAGTLSLHGDATFGALDPARVKRGGVNIGEFDAMVRVGETIAFTVGDGGKTLPYDKGDDDACKMRMRVLGPFLMVEDNHMCGGNNVSFTGNYRRK